MSNNQLIQLKAQKPVDGKATRNSSRGQNVQVRKILNHSYSAPSKISTLNHANEPLSKPVKSKMENLFQLDLSAIKLNTQSTKAVELGANAFTQGTQIHFAPGLYNPDTPKGKSLIAHELAHVVQQSRNKVKPTNLYHGTLVNDCSELEHEADQMGQRASRMGEANALNSNWQTNLNKQKVHTSSNSTQAIQKEDNETGFDINYSLLPPSLQLRLWVLSLDANTSRVRLSRDFGSISAGINYSYGSAISADISSGGFRGSLGVDPSNANLSLGGSYGGFRASASGNIGQRSFGLNLGYGSRLLPFPTELSSIFNSGAQGLGNVVGDISSAPDNPLAWYGLHSDDISTITSAVRTGMQIRDQQTSSQNFGAGLRLSYLPATGFMIYGGVQLVF